MAITMAKVDFPSFREGWGIPPGNVRHAKAHYVVRRDLTNIVRSICGSVETMIDHHGTGFYALWQQGSFPRCKSCQRMKNRK